MKDHALRYAELGFDVLPLHTTVGHECSCNDRENCRKAGKHPRISNGSKGATRDPAKIVEWWTKWPEANIGIATGPSSRVFVLDVDGALGLVSLNQGPSLPATLTVLTGRREPTGERLSIHLYFLWNAEFPTRNNQKSFAKGLDIRGIGGYVVAPPSLHASGSRYEWVDKDVPIADAPPWLLKALAQPANRQPESRVTAKIYAGSRNDKLFRLACRWRANGDDEDTMLVRLRKQNQTRCAPELPELELTTIARNAAKYPITPPDSLAVALKLVMREDHAFMYTRLLSLIGYLKKSQGDLPILLPLERIAEGFHCNHTLVSRHRRWAVSEGYIREVAPHNHLAGIAKSYEVLVVPDLTSSRQKSR